MAAAAPADEARRARALRRGARSAEKK